ncbi:MAG: alpha/beta fold hydrolase [Myxococcota bacterium]
MRRIALALLALLVGVPLGVWLGARASLDGERRHAAATRALPLLSPDTDRGLVRVAANGFTFRARVAGLGGDGPGLVLLHGWPETSIMWEPLLARAAEAGFRVVAFDQRGYSPGARPTGTAAYAVAGLVDDLMAVADAAGFERFHLVGHDWGSIVGWAAAARRPDRVASWASLSIAHPGALRDPESPPSTPLYVRLFRAPGVAESFLGFGGRLAMHRVLYAGMSDAHRAEYDAVFAEPGALTATLEWYRALDPAAPDMTRLGPVRQRVLYVYGEHDIPVFVNAGVQERLPAFVEGPFERIALDAGHWLIEEQEAIVVDALMEHLATARAEEEAR